MGNPQDIGNPTDFARDVIRDLEADLDQALAERDRLERENVHLRKRLAAGGTCGCRERCGDLPEGEDDPDAVCRNLPRRDTAASIRESSRAARGGES